VGKSTLARALGVAAARAGWKVKLADLDALQRTLVLWDQTRRRNNVMPAIKVDAVDDFKEAIAEADRDTMLIFDTPGQMSQVIKEIAQRADLIVQPTGPGQDDMHPALLVFQALTNVGVPGERLVFALCRTLSKREESVAYRKLMASGYAVLPSSIPEDIVYREAHEQGKALTETRKGALNRRALALLDPLLRYARASVAASRRKQRGPVRNLHR
jgi:chromosome partitioning protein